MLNKTTLHLWLKKKETRKFRIFMSFFCILIMAAAIVLLLSALLPRYVMTMDERLSFLTPNGFKMSQMYDFRESSSKNKNGAALVNRSMSLPLPDSRQIQFQYPEVINLGNSSYLSDEITQSMDFTLTKPKAYGLIQIWSLSSSFEDFLKNSQANSQTRYISFKISQSRVNQLEYTLWDYCFESRNKTIHALEAFFDDKPYLYRFSLFFDEKNYNEEAKKIFEELLASVRVE